MLVFKQMKLNPSRRKHTGNEAVQSNVVEQWAKEYFM